MYLETPSIDQVLDACRHVNLSTPSTICIFVAEAAELDIPELIDTLRAANIDFIGGVFPAVIGGDRKSNHAVVINAFPVMDQIYLIQGLDQADITLPDFSPILDNLDYASDIPAATALLLVDGLTRNIGTFLSEMYNCLGDSVNYLGGGAGSLSLKQKPCLFSPQGYFQDAALVAFLQLPSGLGVRHGWQRLQGPMVATQTEKTIITQLNWQTAFDVYRATVETDSEKALRADNFFDIAKGYPFGIFKAGQEDIVRDPILVNEAGALVCVGEVSENASLYILKGTVNSLIAAAAQAARDSIIVSNHEDQVHSVIVVDCISRVLFLEDHFDQELTAVQQGLDTHAVMPEGILSIGEISSYGDGLLEFFNKTMVVATLYRQP